MPLRHRNTEKYFITVSVPTFKIKMKKIFLNQIPCFAEVIATEAQKH
jgi:hypothetical protein